MKEKVLSWAAGEDAGVLSDCCGKNGAELEDKTFQLLVNLCSKPLL